MGTEAPLELRLRPGDEERGHRVGMAVGVRGHAPQDLAVLALAERLHLRLDELRGFLRDRALASQGLAQDGARGKEQHLLASTTVAERRGAGISLTSNVRGRTSAVRLCRKTPVCVTKSRH